MMSYALSFVINVIIIHIFSRAETSGAATEAYTATDLILLNCGASTVRNDTSQRSWDGDEGSRYVPSDAAAKSSASEASFLDPSAFEIPYRTGRVFSSPFPYTFPVSSGQIFLRLYFYPAVYSGVDTTQSFFSLTANSYTLLRNFSAFLHGRNASRPSFMKEFIISIGQTQRLDLTFKPNPNSVAFVNGIEIVSIPDELYLRGGNDVVPLKFVDQLYYLNNSTALENLYRLNVGGALVDIKDDSGPTRGMFRCWTSDDEYLTTFSDFGWTPHREEVPINYTAQTPPYTAPPIVYTSARMIRKGKTSLDWGFLVDTGFYYLLRFHFCEFFQEITEQNQRVFTININGKTAEIETDVIREAGGPRIPIYRDYITFVPGDGNGGKQDLMLSLVPLMATQPKYISALLNGLEIFKLNDSAGSFAAANPELAIDDSPPSVAGKPPGKKKNGSVIYPVIGSVVGALAVAAVVCFLILRRRRKVKDSATSVAKSSWMPLSIGSSSTGVSLPSDLCRYFSIDEIKTATRNFDDNFIVGRGGFGNVYKGLIDNAATTVAIKRLNPSSSQGAREFLTEIEMLSKLRHHHLVSLIGYCGGGGEMILVYDYMAHGTLRDHLYNSEKSPLTWKQRLQICLGAAKGLDHLHTGAKHAIIHRDVKSTNILLDEKLVAKVSDFGLSKVGPAAGSQAHVSTVVKGSFGYVDPEYYRRQQLTLKSDVYSFGVVMFEVLCARPPIIPSLPQKQVNLGEWAKFCFRKGTLDQIIDSNLHGQMAPECLSKFVETAVACLKDKGIDRPSMNDIVWSLEFATQLQASAESGGDAADADGQSFVAVNASQPLLGFGASTTTEEETFSRSKSSDFSTSSSDKCKSGDAFSELMNPTGR